MDDFIEIECYDTESTSYPSFRGNKKKSDKVTDPLMTPFEYARLLSCRAKQIAAGMPLHIEWKGQFDPIAIAKSEIEQRLGTLVIIRKIPDVSKPSGFRDEMWELSEMDIRDS